MSVPDDICNSGDADAEKKQGRGKPRPCLQNYNSII